MVYKITSFIIAIVVSSLFITTLSSFYYEAGSQNNNTLTAETNETIANLTKIQNMHDIAEDIESRHGEDSVDKSAFDIVGTLLADTLSTIKLFGASTGAFFGMANVGLETFKLNINFKLALYVVIITMIIVGVFIRLKLKQQI